ncbi:hypothetical protein BVC71_11500 [Marivivens niveibacter]|uniref:DUF2065 domain-containing protein n=1 Tax=Marivivens niveibacter TaxID=1930667 RepID=A0A251WZF2_9RHOB|nr:DUF2065 domain-containing protein [Marivivens niveibacter]OUD09313.1 hypothetical protein BVC71_11500 [Marivivens niveibacter]
MLNTLIYCLGVVCVVEGLAYVLAPSFVKRLMMAFNEIPRPQRRLIGAVIFLAGIVLIGVSTQPTH